MGFAITQRATSAVTPAERLVAGGHPTGMSVPSVQLPETLPPRHKGRLSPAEHRRAIAQLGEIISAPAERPGVRSQAAAETIRSDAGADLFEAEPAGDGYRFKPPVPGTVAQLAVVIVAPTEGAIPGGHRTGVGIAGIDLTDRSPPATATGCNRAVVVPSPSWPQSLGPQQ